MGLVDKLKGALFGTSGSSWRDRLRPAEYKTPKGKKLSFLFYDLSRSYDLRGEAFEFPDLDGAYIQRNGVGPRRYPMRLIFTGKDHDRDAATFEAALFEEGRGVFNHPVYGPADVVPLGTVTRRDDLKTAANQSIIEVTLWTSLEAPYPASATDPVNEILALLDNFLAAMPAKMGLFEKINSAIEQAAGLGKVGDVLGDISEVTAELSNTVAQVKRTQDRQLRNLQVAKDTLITDPIALVNAMAELVLGPVDAIAGIFTKVDTYDSLAKKVLAQSDSSGDSSADTRAQRRSRANFAVEEMTVNLAVAGAVKSTTSDAQPLKSRREAIEAADSLIALLEEVQDWRDSREASLASPETTDDGEAFSSLQGALLLSVNHLIEQSFSLVAERIVVTDRPRTIVDLAAELYGNVDNETLDRLIDDNDLTASEILELPRGSIIRSYPAAA